MKIIKVVAAVICDSLEYTTKIFATAKGYGEFKGQWKFPGGKIEARETSQQALIREIQEELAVKIEVGELIDTIEYDYPTFHLSMDCFRCNVVDGEIAVLIQFNRIAKRWGRRNETKKSRGYRQK
ncbi:MAG: (deoxy)nucleoside triphosphate pyrophosphohydrolase [Candidatus Ornithomonoglobus sp.]